MLVPLILWPDVTMRCKLALQECYARALLGAGEREGEGVWDMGGLCVHIQLHALLEYNNAHVVLEHPTRL